MNRTSKPLLVVAGLALGTAAFLRGNYLLGADVGILYAIAVAGLVGLFARSRTTAGAVVAVAFALVVGVVLTWPTAINSDLRYFIDDHAFDRAVRTGMATAFASDEAYGDLSVSSVRLKVVNFTIHGSLATRSDLDRLRPRIAAECPTLGRGSLHWDVVLRDSGQRVKGLDRDLVSEAAPGK